MNASYVSFFLVLYTLRLSNTKIRMSGINEAATSFPKFHNIWIIINCFLRVGPPAISIVSLVPNLQCPSGLILSTYHRSVLREETDPFLKLSLIQFFQCLAGRL